MVTNLRFFIWVFLWQTLRTKLIKNKINLLCIGSLSYEASREIKLSLWSRFSLCILHKSFQHSLSQNVEKFSTMCWKLVENFCVKCTKILHNVENFCAKCTNVENLLKMLKSFQHLVENLLKMLKSFQHLVENVEKFSTSYWKLCWKSWTIVENPKFLCNMHKNN